MNKCITIFILLVTVSKFFAQSPFVSLFNEVNHDSIEVSIEDELKSIDILDKTIKLKNLRAINCQMDSILRSITEEKKGKYVSSYYLALAKHEGSFYIEIMNIDSHNNLITFFKRGISSDNYLRKGTAILGCIVYNDSYFYVISFPIPNLVEEKDVNTLFGFTNKEIIIKIEKTDDALFFIESPIRLYQFENEKLNLIHSPH